jgi:predicted transposase YbfD/YdcC
MQAREIIALKKQLVEKDAKLAEKDTETEKKLKNGMHRTLYLRTFFTVSTTKNNATRDGRLWSM